MARAAQEPPSPVDAYEAPTLATPVGDPPPPEYYGTTVVAQPTTPPQGSGELNDLAVIALIASCVGLSIPGLVMGHIALRQIKKSGETGRGFALAAVIVGYVITVLVLLAVVAFIVFMIAVFVAAGSAVQEFGSVG
jgi:peptidyl-prolyl cis-trans isomerase B (cyclophilin B)